MSSTSARTRVVAGVAGLGLLLGACGQGTPEPAASGRDQASVPTSTTTPSDPDVTLLSAADGAAARQIRAAATLQSEAATARLASDTSIAVDCGIDGEEWTPSPEELAAANADTDALAQVFDTYHIAYTRSTDDVGYAYLEWDWTDVVASSVSDSFWQLRYPPEPIAPEDLARIAAENDAIAAALDAVGVTYTRHRDDNGWEWIEYDYEDTAANEAVSAVYEELYPPIPPTAEELAQMRSENDKLAAAFDAAGIAYTRVADEAGWEWIEWDYEDEAIGEAVDAVFNELYPPIAGEPCIYDDLARIPVTEDEIASTSRDQALAEERETEGDDDLAEPQPADEPAIDPIEGVERVEIGPEESGFTPAEIAQRDADVAAMTSGFDAADVDYDTWGESPWQIVIFDLDNPAAPAVIHAIVDARG